MNKNLPNPDTIKVIFFDVNGTLRTREPHEPTQLAAYQKILNILGKESVPESFWKDLEGRYKSYTVWAQSNLIQLSESEIWTQWFLPKEPPELISLHADELMLAWIERKGWAVPKAEVQETLCELLRRGYLLGIISNSISTLDIPQFLSKFGWTDYFSVIVLSSVEKSRKPAPDLFSIAANSLQLTPSQCAHVGNRISKDIVGCKKAGFALGIALEKADGSALIDENQQVTPDLKVHAFSELLDYFISKKQ